MEHRPSTLTRWLQSAPKPVLVFFAVGAAFSTYFAMHALRKPYLAGQYVGFRFFDMELKTALVICQIFGYGLAKFAGIKFVSEWPRERRFHGLVACGLGAQLTLLLFALLPPAWKPAALFLNGFSLGMIWGLVVWYLEGRRTSEFLLAGLACSFIVASAVVKDVGLFLMSFFELSEWWMPFFTGIVFLPVYWFAAWCLNQTPGPDPADIEARTERVTMGHRERLGFVLRFLPGLALLFLAYFFITAYRDFRDAFQVEIFSGLGLGEERGIISRTDTLVAFLVLGTLALLYFVKDNRRGLLGALLVMIAGVAILGGSTLAFQMGHLDGRWWMVLNGLGAFLAYVPYNTVLFDRLVASTHSPGNAVFSIYVADAVGYAGVIGVFFYKDSVDAGSSRLEFFTTLSYVMAAVGLVLLGSAVCYFRSLPETDIDPTKAS